MSSNDDFKVDVSEYQLVFKLLKDLNKDPAGAGQDQDDSLKISKIYDLIQAFEAPTKSEKPSREKTIQSSSKAASKSKESSIEKRGTYTEAKQNNKTVNQDKKLKSAKKLGEFDSKKAKSSNIGYLAKQEENKNEVNRDSPKYQKSVVSNDSNQNFGNMLPIKTEEFKEESPEQSHEVDDKEKDAKSSLKFDEFIDLIKVS